MCRAEEAQHSSPRGGAGALLEEAPALQLRGVGAAASEAEAAVVALAAAPAPRPGKALGQDATEGPMEVAAGGGCGAGPPLLLSDSEQQCYSELFARCAGAASGGPGPGPPEATKVAPGTATAATGPVADLFRASQLPPETLHQVCLCTLLSLSGLWGQCLWEEWGNNDYSQGLFPGIWRAVARTAKKGCSAAEDGGDALVPRDTSLLCSSSAPSLVLGCALRPLRKSDTPIISGGSTISQTQSLPCSESGVCFGCCLL